MPASQGARKADLTAERGEGEGALTRHDGHPFRPGASRDACALCGESPAHILHHPTRIRAACALRGIDPEPLLARPKR